MIGQDFANDLPPSNNDHGKSMFKFNEAIEFENRAEFTIGSVNMVGDDVRVDAFNSASLSAIKSSQAQG